MKRKLVSKIRQHQKNVAKNIAPPINKDEEFTASLEYLQLLKKQKDENNRRNLLETSSKTLKQSPQQLSQNISSNPVAIYQELPEELLLTPFSKPVAAAALIEVPYGAMKNGTKPTYREWINQTRKRQPNEKTEPEKKLAELKAKIRKADQLSSSSSSSSLSSFTNLSIVPTTTSIPFTAATGTMIVPVTSAATTNEMPAVPIVVPAPSFPIKTKPSEEGNVYLDNKTVEKDLRQIVPNAPKIHQTFKKVKRISIGKQENDNSVRVLLKNDYTRKQVMNAQSLLSKKPMQAIKEYLKDHNLIKVGTTAPPDVLRKMYESAMLTGEVTNNNKENLIHNFLSDK
jgi:hypothetical protein